MINCFFGFDFPNHFSLTIGMLTCPYKWLFPVAEKSLANIVDESLWIVVDNIVSDLSGAIFGHLTSCETTCSRSQLVHNSVMHDEDH